MRESSLDRQKREKDGMTENKLEVFERVEEKWREMRERGRGGSKRVAKLSDQPSMTMTTAGEREALLHRRNALSSLLADK